MTRTKKIARERTQFNMWKSQMNLNNIYLPDEILMEFVKNKKETEKDIKNIIEDAIKNLTDTRYILQFIESQNIKEKEESNCNICGDILLSHIYGNVCAKHIPSYALW